MWNEYQRLVARTANMGASEKKRMTNWCYGLIGEVGELCETFKKPRFHGHDLDPNNVIKELGDVTWYLSQICNEEQINVTELLNTSTNYYIAYLDYLCSMPFQGEALDFLMMELFVRASDIVKSYKMELFGDNLISQQERSHDIRLCFFVWKELVHVISKAYPTCSHITAQLILDTNAAKLKKRYPDGFSTQDSLNRTM